MDELNANLACVLVHSSEESEVCAIILALQHQLFNVGGELSAPQCELTHAADILWLEQWIDHFNQDLPALKDFILPGGDAAVAHCHVARTVCRRAERHLVEWSSEHELRVELLQYVNRLSDLLFVLCRVLEKLKQTAPSYWQKDLKLPQPKKMV